MALLFLFILRSKLVQPPALGLNNGSTASFPTLGHIRAPDIGTASKGVRKGPQGSVPSGFLLSGQAPLSRGCLAAQRLPGTQGFPIKVLMALSRSQQSRCAQRGASSCDLVRRLSGNSGTEVCAGL